MIAAVTGGAALLKVVLSALAAAVGVTAMFSLAVLGAARYSDARRAEENGAATIYGLVVLIAFAACATAVVYGILLISRKS
jgi:cytochrome c biogenesis protein CcdA